MERMNWPADMYQMHKDTVDNELGEVIKVGLKLEIHDCWHETTPDDAGLPLRSGVELTLAGSCD